MTIKKGTTIIATGGSTHWGSIEGPLSDQEDLSNALSLKAPLLNPSFTGTPTAPTAVAGTNTTQIATTEFVKTAVSSIDTLPDQTDMEGKYLATDGVTAFWKSPAGLPMFSFIWSDHILNDSSFLRADTFSWQSGYVYKSAYNHLVEDIDGITPSTETIGSNTITYYKATDGHKIVLLNMEETVMDIYQEMGTAWYYVLDTTNRRFKLPRTKWGFVGFRNSVGKLVEAGLPNITASDENFPNFLTGNTGTDPTTQDFDALYFSNAEQNGIANSGSHSYRAQLAFDASRSNSIYGNSDTVQQQSTEMYLYFYVGNTIRNETEVDVAEITEALNGKLDQDLSNADSSFKSLIMSYCIPNYSYASTLTSSPYTATKNGYICIKNYGTNPGINVSVNNIPVFSTSIATSGSTVSCFIPVSKNDVVTYTLSGTNDWKYFIPMKGEN